MSEKVGRDLTKRNPHLVGRVEARVAQDYPAQYERCLKYLARR
jgi:hypothetical protein